MSDTETPVCPDLSRPRRGRPRVPEPGVSVKTWLRVSEYDRLIALANSRQMNVSTLVRFLLLIDLEPR